MALSNRSPSFCLFVLMLLLSSSMIVWCFKSSGEVIKEKAQDVKHTVEETLQGGDKSESWAGWAKDKISGGLGLKQDEDQQVEDAAQKRKEKMEDVSGAGKQQVGEATAVERAQEALEEAKSKSEGKVTDAVTEAEQELVRAEEIAKRVSETIKDGTTESVGDAKDTLTHQEEAAKQKASHATGGGAADRDQEL